MTDETTAIVFQQPGKLTVSRVGLNQATVAECVVEIEWSGISSGTERLLWTGRMPDFPGMGYPLVPGYESVGRIVEAGDETGFRIGERVFVPGAQCFSDVRGLFGGAAARLVVPAERLVSLGDDIGVEGTLAALAATAYHALRVNPGRLPDLVVGHGVLGRLIARLIVALGGDQPTVWEQNPGRRAGNFGYPVTDAEQDPRRDYELICDVSGDADILDTLIARLAPGGGILLAGFYDQALHFQFPAAFMREARILVAAEWKPEDLAAVLELIRGGPLALDGLISHRAGLRHAVEAYRTAFSDSECLKMIIDWRHSS